MQRSTAQSVDRSSQQAPRRSYRIERQFSTQRPPRELVRDLLRAHSGEQSAASSR